VAVAGFGQAQGDHQGQDGRGAGHQPRPSVAVVVDHRLAHGRPDGEASVEEQREAGQVVGPLSLGGQVGGHGGGRRVEAGARHALHQPQDDDSAERLCGGEGDRGGQQDGGGGGQVEAAAPPVDAAPDNRSQHHGREREGSDAHADGSPGGAQFPRDEQRQR
jgi:hypothetical protein